MPPLPTGVGQAIVTTETVSENVPTGDQAAQFLTANDRSIYTDYRVMNRFEADGHKYMLGITSPGGFNGGSAAFVQLAAKTLLWISDWTASRMGDFPIIPNPEPVDTSWVLLDEHVEPAQLSVAADGVTPFYRISGTYVYGHKNPAATTIRDIMFPRPPWLADAFPRTMSNSQMQQGIINVNRARQTIG